MSGTVLLSMDVEEWWDLEYFRGAAPPRAPSVLDGVERFRALLAEEGVPATFFTLGSVAAGRGPLLRALRVEGHEVASHGPDHALLRGRDPDAFAREMAEHKDALEQVAGAAVTGYRAPCFSLERSQLERLPELGFRYDSSWIRCPGHPLYGEMDLSDWEPLVPGARRMPGTGLVELEVPTVEVMGRRVPVGGGAWFRTFPWAVTAALLERHLRASPLYVFYIHPFECSAVDAFPLPAGTGRGTRLRFGMGRRWTLPRLRRMIRLLRARGFQFRTGQAAVDALSR